MQIYKCIIYEADVFMVIVLDNLPCIDAIQTKVSEILKMQFLINFNHKILDCLLLVVLTYCYLLLLSMYVVIFYFYFARFCQFFVKFIHFPIYFLKLQKTQL